MVIFESNLSSRAFGREIEMPLLEVLGRAMAVVLAIYGLLKFQDLWGAGRLSTCASLPRRRSCSSWRLRWAC